MGSTPVATDVTEESGWERRWARVLDAAATLWVVRAPLAALLIGFVLLDIAPQTQDLPVELSDSLGRTTVFFLTLTLVWALPTHYVARLLLDTDERYAVRIAARGVRARFLLHLQRWT